VFALTGSANPIEPRSDLPEFDLLIVFHYDMDIPTRDFHTIIIGIPHLFFRFGLRRKSYRWGTETGVSGCPSSSRIRAVAGAK
jgi:hypothetical protein